MQLITNNGKRLDRRADLADLIQSPYAGLTEAQRQRVKRILLADHNEREILRFGHVPTNPGEHHEYH